jgi:NADH:ubiquinone oxidoreductase subunit 5 (subunit L)/multisubunit Na+/H+ antiporter MnhA subunit
LGVITSLFGGVTSLCQSDVKKILAYSTMSNCGVLLIFVGFGQFDILVLYMVLHGLLKAATFLCAGGFVKFYRSQDIRLWGFGNTFLKSESFILLLCLLNLFCLPTSFGFFLKEMLLTNFFINFNSIFDMGCVFILIISSSFYSIKIFYKTVLEFFRILYKSCVNYVTNTIVTLYKYFFLKITYYLSVKLLLGFGFIILALILLIWFIGEAGILYIYNTYLLSYIKLIGVYFFNLSHYISLYALYIVFAICCFIIIYILRSYYPNSTKIICGILYVLF